MRELRGPWSGSAAAGPVSRGFPWASPRTGKRWVLTGHRAQLGSWQLLLLSPSACTTPAVLGVGV